MNIELTDGTRTYSFGSLSPAAQHAWLAANIAALRAGTLTLAQIP